jgi:hypothetical protein
MQSLKGTQLEDFKLAWQTFLNRRMVVGDLTAIPEFLEQIATMVPCAVDLDQPIPPRCADQQTLITSLQKQGYLVLNENTPDLTEQLKAFFPNICVYDKPSDALLEIEDEEIVNYLREQGWAVHEKQHDWLYPD